MKNQPTPPLIGIPALVVSGFLGAGKTTLVQHLLKDAQRQGLRLAIVSNEFGALGIDQALLGNQGSNSYVELEGGCVCCKLSDELVKTLQQLWEDVQPDRIVVETSGVALPFETLINFWREPVTEWVGDSITVVVVNAEQVAEGRDLDGTFEQQVSSADLLIVGRGSGTRSGEPPHDRGLDTLPLSLLVAVEASAVLPAQQSVRAHRVDQAGRAHPFADPPRHPQGHLPGESQPHVPHSSP